MWPPLSHSLTINDTITDITLENMGTPQTLPELPSATQASTNFCMYYIEDGAAGRNQTKSLTTCCSPNPVKTESQNAQWCEIPDRFFKSLPEPGTLDLEASRWLQGNFTLCQQRDNPDTGVGTNYCNLPKYNPNLNAAASFQGQQQLFALCLVLWLWVFCR
ncbi:uncharacterized protein N7500_008023 [Penicillium coprophilum]|uniref:uncharacterized protein n=1 Tax=Penicillium coprophilum TaxID=36646 RepID=UPI0023842BE2|nr:uncharacterized protein N7500_008023 [Penicillium coprophilum]KAJ5158372.1 hypothetical protein N7500_008023 [Penicillium coprophilum]